MVAALGLVGEAGPRACEREDALTHAEAVPLDLPRLTGTRGPACLRWLLCADRSCYGVCGRNCEQSARRMKEHRNRRPSIGTAQTLDGRTSDRVLCATVKTAHRMSIALFNNRSRLVPFLPFP